MKNSDIDINKPVQTRDGRKVTNLINYFDGPTRYVIGKLEAGTCPITWWYANGDMYKNEESHLDIVNVPEKVMVPLTVDDIEPSDIFKKKHDPAYKFIKSSMATSDFVCMYRMGAVRFLELKDSYEISRDGGKTWQNCEKEVEV